MTGPRLLVVVERADHWRLEIWTPYAPRGRCLYEGSSDRLVAVAAGMAGPQDEIHILPRTASDWYGPTHRYTCAPVRQPRT